LSNKQNESQNNMQYLSTKQSESSNNIRYSSTKLNDGNQKGYNKFEQSTIISPKKVCFFFYTKVIFVF